MRNDAQCKKVGNYKHIRLSVIYQKGCCFGRNNRPRTDITVYFVHPPSKNQQFLKLSSFLISNQMIDLLFFTQPPILKCVTERPRTKVPVSATPWNASVRVKLTHGMQFHSQGLNSYASLAVRGQERCALALGIWVCSLCLFLVKSLAFNN